MTDAFDRHLRDRLGEARVRRNEPLARYTTFRVGGPADWLVELRSADDVKAAVAIAGDHGVPLTILGGGSNVLIADAGIRGLVIRIHGGDVVTLDSSHVRADGGVTINGLVRWTINHGFGGIEAWAGTPGTVGGAIYGNAHFRGRLIAEIVDRVTLAARSGDVAEVPAAAMEFGYDYSRLHRTGEIVLSAVFRGTPGDSAALRAVARESLAFRKRTQPLECASAGCIFQNPDRARDRLPDDVPPSAGALVERAGLKGARTGQAMVSTTHANFIVNHGGASAREITDLIDRCKEGVAKRFGVQLREEIVYLGFDETANQARDKQHGQIAD